MYQQRKKDYLARIIEDFFAKLQSLKKDSNGDYPLAEKKRIVRECLGFFYSNFAVKRDDNTEILTHKIGEYELIEQYARMLAIEYEAIDIKYEDNLLKALSLIEYLQKHDSVYSWERTVLREDILRLLDKNT